MHLPWTLNTWYLLGARLKPRAVAIIAATTAHCN
jgi:hypothetical protein